MDIMAFCFCIGLYTNIDKFVSLNNENPLECDLDVIFWRGCSIEPGGLKWTSDFKRNYGVYIGTTDANKKTSRKVSSKFENVWTYIAGGIYRLGGSVTLLWSSFWDIGILSAKQGGQIWTNWHFRFFRTVNLKLCKETHY